MILKQYVNLKPDKDINISYVVGGITKDNKHKICIVRDDKYDEAKIKFSQLTIDHIYSIQKSRLDWASVFNVNDFLCDDIESKEAKSKREKHDSPEVKREKSPAKLAKVSCSFENNLYLPLYQTIILSNINILLAR